jgi:hypothetical protein
MSVSMRCCLKNSDCGRCDEVIPFLRKYDEFSRRREVQSAVATRIVAVSVWNGNMAHINKLICPKELASLRPCSSRFLPAGCRRSRPRDRTMGARASTPARRAAGSRTVAFLPRAGGGKRHDRWSKLINVGHIYTVIARNAATWQSIRPHGWPRRFASLRATASIKRYA